RGGALIISMSSVGVLALISTSPEKGSLPMALTLIVYLPGGTCLFSLNAPSPLVLPQVSRLLSVTEVSPSATSPTSAPAIGLPEDADFTTPRTVTAADGSGIDLIPVGGRLSSSSCAIISATR